MRASGSKQYAIAVGAVVAAIALRASLAPFLQDRSPFLLFTLAVMTASAYGGFAPGMLATALGTVAGAWLFAGAPASISALNTPALFSLALFAGIGVAISSINRRIHRLQEAVASEDKKYRLLVESVKDYAIYGIDQDGNVASWNAGAERIKGYTAEEIIGRKYAVFFTPEDRERQRPEAALQSAMETGHFHGQGWRLHKDGSRLWADVTITALRFADGTLRGFSNVTRDLTAQRHAEETLRENEATIRALLESAAQGILAETPDGRIVLANATAERMFGYARPELLSMPMDNVIRESAGKATGYRKDGSEFPVEVSRSTFELRTGVRKVAFISDITDRKRAEAEVQQLNEELERRVQERTRQLQDANTELESFSYSVSHDLRAPLRSVDGFGNILLRDYGVALDPRAQDLIRRMRAATNRMGQLIEALLNLSRLSRQPVRRQEVDLGAVAESVATDLRSRDPDREVRIVIQEGGLTADCDARLMRIVLDNLLGNAWKFTRNCANATVEFSATETGTGVVFCVRDNGSGFNMEYKDQLFVPFQRLHGAEDFEGTGIGLATAQRIIHRHGGSIWAESEAGNGAAFFFTVN
jgi:PAS domain S-box-containing protein